MFLKDEVKLYKLTAIPSKNIYIISKGRRFADNSATALKTCNVFEILIL